MSSTHANLWEQKKVLTKDVGLPHNMAAVSCFFENEYGYRDVISLQKRSIALHALALFDSYVLGLDLTIHGHVWLAVSCPLTQHTISYSSEPSFSSTAVPTYHHRKTHDLITMSIRPS